jgi:hypothetical protein
MTLPTRLRPVLAAGALVAAFAAAAPAQAASGITILSPKNGATVPTGERPTFKMRVKGSGQVWVHVCESKKKDSKGVICNGGDAKDMGRATRKNGVFSYKGKFFDFPEYWLNSPGSYYWQAYRIACEGGNTSDCLLESKITKITVG